MSIRCLIYWVYYVYFLVLNQHHYFWWFRMLNYQFTKWFYLFRVSRLTFDRNDTNDQKLFFCLCFELSFSTTLVPFHITILFFYNFVFTFQYCLTIFSSFQHLPYKSTCSTGFNHEVHQFVQTVWPK